MKRLFLFAAYDPDDMLSQVDMLYIKSLSEIGDIIFCADNHLSDNDIELLKPHVLHAEAVKHNEYDFGSYKRCWNWAKSNLNLEAYDFIYLANNSVVGPFRPLTPILDFLERDAAVTGMCYCPRRKGSHIQSWFVGVGKSVFSRSEFDGFFQKIQVEKNKWQIYIKYENGLTKLLESMGYKKNILLVTPGKSVYNKVKALFQAGLPFIKKSAFTRHNGCLGRQINYVLRHSVKYVGNDASEALRNALAADLDRFCGPGYFQTLTAASPLTICLRYLKYLLAKLRILRESLA